LARKHARRRFFITKITGPGTVTGTNTGTVTGTNTGTGTGPRRRPAAPARGAGSVAGPSERGRRHAAIGLATVVGNDSEVEPWT